jgi:surface polysaccharide O-acyltransferase-like enzyme
VTERLVWADAARTLACGLVVLVHVNIYTRAGLETWWPFGFAGMPLFCIAVPAFMVLAGYFAKSAEDGARPSSSGSARRVLRLLVPFLVWNVLTLGALCAEGLRPDAPEVVLQILTGTWQLYFIFALLQLLVIHRLVRGRADPPALAVAAGATVAIYALGDLLLWKVQGADNGAFETLSEKLFLSWTVFFFAGIALRRHPEAFDVLVRRKRLALLALAASYALFLWELLLEERRFGYDPRKQVLLGGLPFHLLGAVLLLALLRNLNLSARGGGALSRLAAAGTDTYGIYLSHTAVLVAVFAAARTLSLTTFRTFETPLLFLATWALSIGLVRLTRRLAPGWLRFALLGERASDAPAS